MSWKSIKIFPGANLSWNKGFLFNPLLSFQDNAIIIVELLFSMTRYSFPIRKPYLELQNPAFCQLRFWWYFLSSHLIDFLTNFVWLILDTIKKKIVVLDYYLGYFSYCWMFSSGFYIFEDFDSSYFGYNLARRSFNLSRKLIFLFCTS